MNKSCIIHVFGLVQGVFFRDSCRQKAVSLGIKGYARNMPNGSVEIYAQGDGEKIKELIEWAKNGTPRSRVDKIDVQEYSLKEEYKDFVIN